MLLVEVVVGFITKQKEVAMDIAMVHLKNLRREINNRFSHPLLQFKPRSFVSMKLAQATLLALTIGLVGVFLNTIVAKANEGKMPVSFRELAHGVPVLEKDKHTVAGAEVRLYFLIDRIEMDNRWLEGDKVPKAVVYFADLVGYGPADLYLVSVGDIIIWFSVAATLILLTLLSASVCYYTVKSYLYLKVWS